MSLSDVGLRKKLQSFFKPAPQYTLEHLNVKSAKCEALFEQLHDCVAAHGWNDNQCQAVIKPKYDRCVVKRVSV